MTLSGIRKEQDISRAARDGPATAGPGNVELLRSFLEVVKYPGPRVPGAPCLGEGQVSFCGRNLNKVRVLLA